MPLAIMPLETEKLAISFCFTLFYYHLFCHAISTIGFSLGNDHFTDLDYADDVAILAHTADEIHTARKASDTAEYIELFGSFAQDHHAGRI